MNRSTLFVVLTAFVIALAACGAPPTANLTPMTPVPATPTLVRSSGSFAGAGGAQLFEQSWRPTSAPRAAFVINHGLMDHSSRYDELAQKLVARGIAVHAFDMRGHGHSSGARVVVDSFEDYVTDLDLYVTKVKAEEHDIPTFVMGHSMGGAIVTLWAMEKKPKVAGVILSGPALHADVDAAKIGGIKLISALSPNAGVFKLDIDKFSRDPNVVAACKSDPLVYQPGAPAHTAKELLGALHKIDHGMDHLFVPLLLLHGAADEITDPNGSRALYDRTPASDRTLHIYPELVHDLVHEPEKEKVMSDIVEWTDAHVRALEERARDAVSRPGFAPTPYSAKQIRAATYDGRALVYKRETPGATVTRELVFTRVNDDGTDVITTEKDAASGKETKPKETTHAGWEELRKHAEFPKDAVTIEDASITTPSGTYDCMHYTVVSDDTTSHFWFAKNLAGPPVFFTMDKKKTRVMTTTLIEKR